MDDLNIVYVGKKEDVPQFSYAGNQLRCTCVEQWHHKINADGIVWQEPVKEAFFNLIPQCSLHQSFEAFWYRVFARKNFLKVKRTDEKKELINFHARHKYLLFCFGQEGKDQLGHLLATIEFEDLQRYEELLFTHLSSPWRAKFIINAYEHVFGYFKKVLRPKEKKESQELIASFRKNPTSTQALRGYVQKRLKEHLNAYLRGQVLLEELPSLESQVIE